MTKSTKKKPLTALLRFPPGAEQRIKKQMKIAEVTGFAPFLRTLVMEGLVGRETRDVPNV
jgi:hypothetical protein